MILTDEQLGPPVYGDAFAEDSDPVDQVRESLTRILAIERGWYIATSDFDNAAEWAPAIDRAVGATTDALAAIPAGSAFAGNAGTAAYARALDFYGGARDALATTPDQVPTPGLLDELTDALRSAAPKLELDGTRIALYGIGAVALLIIAKRVIG